MSNNNETLIFLPLTSCHLIDIPEDATDCSVHLEDGVNHTTCVICPISGRYITGEGINDIDLAGHNVCLCLWILVIFIGSFGAVANLLILAILNRKRNAKGFDTLLCGLAMFDFFCSVFSIFTGSFNIAYFQNWSRSMDTVQAYRVTVYIALYCRSCSSFITVVIGIERFLVVTFPTQIHTQSSLIKARILVFIVALFSFLMTVPRFTSTYVSENYLEDLIPSLKNLEYIVLPTGWSTFWFVELHGAHEIIDFWVPLPVLILCNGLVFLKLKKIAAKRKALNVHQQKEIRATKMFLPVVFILLICNVEPIVHVVFITFGGVIYRELEMAMLVSTTFNSSINFLIYYLKAGHFRRETRALLAACFNSLSKTLSSAAQNMAVEESTTNTPSTASSSKGTGSSSSTNC